MIISDKNHCFSASSFFFAFLLLFFSSFSIVLDSTSVIRCRRHHFLSSIFSSINWETNSEVNRDSILRTRNTTREREREDQSHFRLVLFWLTWVEISSDSLLLLFFFVHLFFLFIIFFRFFSPSSLFHHDDDDYTA